MTTPFWCRVERDGVRAHGPDAVSYLHSQLSQDVTAIPVGGSAWTFVLDPTGKVEVLARVRRTGDDELVVDTDAGFGDVLLRRLSRFKIRVQAELEPVALSCVSVRGVEVSSGAVAWGVGADLFDTTPPDGVAEGSAADLLAARIDAAWPAMGAEIVPGETIPAETGITDRAVSFTKGCYPGQELVERMDSRGASAPRRVVRLDAPDGVAPGDPVVRDGEIVGAYTSVAAGRALAIVKRSAVPA